MRAPLAKLSLLLLLWGAPAFGQGCAMCYASAKGTPREGQLAINRGVTILMIPPFGVLTVGVGLALRYGKMRDEER